MIEDTPSLNTGMPTGTDNAFPPFARAHVSPDAGHAENDLAGSPFTYESGYLCTVGLADELVEKLRKAGEDSEVQHHDNVPLTPKAQAKPATQSAPVSSASTLPPTGTSDPTPKRKNKNDSNDHQMLINRLNKNPHIIEFKGTVLDRNERLKIIAAVALCESGNDPFSAENLDTEFHMMPSSNVSYGHIVHIGLSYGIIQFTQDSGSLGKLLQRMQSKDPGKFSEIFGDNFDELITLTTVGVVTPNVNYASGQSHWSSIRHTSEGEQLTHLAAHNSLPKSKEIRGKRVQPIAITVDGLKQDLWEGIWKQRFTNAGKVDAFQEAELEFAVEGYMNHALEFCKENNVRSALGIAFATACAIRGANKQLLAAAAKINGIAVPFASGSDEKSAVQFIAKLDPGKSNSIGGILVQRDEIIRARTLIKDPAGFLVEDHYYPDTYALEYDE